MIRQRLHIPVTPIELAVAASTPATEVPWPLSSAGVASLLTKSRPGTRRTARSGCLSCTPVSTTATIVVRSPRWRSQAFWARTCRCSHWLVHSGSGGIQSTATTPSLSTLTTSASRAHRPARVGHRGRRHLHDADVQLVDARDQLPAGHVRKAIGMGVRRARTHGQHQADRARRARHGHGHRGRCSEQREGEQQAHRTPRRGSVTHQRHSAGLDAPARTIVRWSRSAGPMGLLARRSIQTRGQSCTMIAVTRSGRLAFGVVLALAMGTSTFAGYAFGVLGPNLVDGVRPQPLPAGTADHRLLPGWRATVAGRRTRHRSVRRRGG